MPGSVTFIEVREGRNTRVDLGGMGRTVGRFEAPKDLGLPIDWSKVRLEFGLKAPHIGWPSDEPFWKFYRAFCIPREGKAAISATTCQSVTTAHSDRVRAARRL